MAAVKEGIPRRVERISLSLSIPLCRTSMFPCRVFIKVLHTCTVERAEMHLDHASFYTHTSHILPPSLVYSLVTLQQINFRHLFLIHN